MKWPGTTRWRRMPAEIIGIAAGVIFFWQFRTPLNHRGGLLFGVLGGFVVALLIETLSGRFGSGTGPATTRPSRSDSTPVRYAPPPE